MTAAALKARASVGADVEGVASAEGSADVSVLLPTDHGLTPLRPTPERPPPPPPSNGTNESEPRPPTNQTPPPPPPPVPNETADAPATFEPREQDVRGQAGAPIRFVVLLTNTANTPQNVSLTVKAPASWEVRLSPEGALLGPDETVPIHGTILTPALVGTSGTIAIFGSGSGGEDVSYVNLCTIGALQSGCRRGEEGDGRNHTAEPTPPANQTHEDPAPEPEPPTPPANETGPTPPANQTEPAPAPAPAPSPSPGPSNGTGGAPPNATRPGQDPAAPGEGSASAEAWVTIEATASNDEEDEEDEEGEDAADDEESPPPVTLDL